MSPSVVCVGLSDVTPWREDVPHSPSSSAFSPHSCQVREYIVNNAKFILFLRASLNPPCPGRQEHYDYVNEHLVMTRATRLPMPTQITANKVIHITSWLDPCARVCVRVRVCEGRSLSFSCRNKLWHRYRAGSRCHLEYLSAVMPFIAGWDEGGVMMDVLRHCVFSVYPSLSCLFVLPTHLSFSEMSWDGQCVLKCTKFQPLCATDRKHG